MGRTTALRRELKQSFFPLLVEKGFLLDESDEPHLVRFHRDVGDVVHVLEVQWDKYGDPTLVINFGTCPSMGVDTERGHFSPEAVYAGWLQESGRLQPRRGHSSSKWFSQKAPWLTRLLGGGALRSPAEVVSELLRLFPEVEAYWSAGTVGDHLSLIRRA